MKKKFTTLDMLQIILGMSAAAVAIIAMINETFQWLYKLVHILIALNLIAFGVQSLKEKGSTFSYFIIGIASMIIVLSLV